MHMYTVLTFYMKGMFTAYMLRADIIKLPHAATSMFMLLTFQLTMFFLAESSANTFTSNLCVAKLSTSKLPGIMQLQIKAATVSEPHTAMQEKSWNYKLYTYAKLHHQNSTWHTLKDLIYFRLSTSELKNQGGSESR